MDTSAALTMDRNTFSKIVAILILGGQALYLISREIFMDVANQLESILAGGLPGIFVSCLFVLCLWTLGRYRTNSRALETILPISLAIIVWFVNTGVFAFIGGVAMLADNDLPIC